MFKKVRGRREFFDLVALYIKNNNGVDEVKLNGYLQYYNITDSQSHMIDQDLLRYQVKFYDSSIDTSDGSGIGILTPRADDWMNKITETGVIEGDGGSPRYKIVVQTTVTPGGTYYGRTFINTFIGEQQDISITTGCISLHSNTIIDSLNDVFRSDNGINILSQFLTNF